RKFEARIFTARQARWGDLLERAASNTAWSWHQLEALEEMKNEALRKGIWVEDGGYLDKEPPLPQTSVNVRELNNLSKDGNTVLKITPINGDTVYYEIEGDATQGSLKVEDLENFTTRELSLSFLCIDSTGQHP